MPNLNAEVDTLSVSAAPNIFSNIDALSLSENSYLNTKLDMGENADSHRRDSKTVDSSARAVDAMIRLGERVARLSLEEKISLLSGSDFWRTTALPQHGIPSIKTTDGPNGARGQFFKNGTPAALFPCGVSLAATWDVDLIHKVGQHLAEEVKARGADALLGPTVGIHRSPLGGRNFESFSEDPFLTGKMAASYIKGLQSLGVAATIKHFIGNEQETERMDVNSVIEERALREIYLKPFEIAVREAEPWAVMSAYNCVNGVHADMNESLLRGVLRDQWMYDGTVMSDWMGTNSTVESVRAGCDLEMPGPSQRRGELLLQAVRDGEIGEDLIDAAAINVLKLVDRTRGLDGPPEQPERTNDNHFTRELIRQAGIDGLTLLKNDRNVLPIRYARKIAVIGPNAKRAIAGGGGSASLNPYYTTAPYDSLKSMTDSELVYAQGCETAKWLPLAESYCRTHDGRDGVSLEYYKGDQFEGEPVEIQHKETTGLYLWDSAPSSVLPAYSIRVKTLLTPSTTGQHTFSLSSVGPGRMYMDGDLFIDNWDWTEEGEAMFDDSAPIEKSVYLVAGTPVQILVESTNEVRPISRLANASRTHHYGGCRLGYREESSLNLLQEAVEAARSADVAVVFVGLDGEWESEGYDRESMDLPKDGSQDRLIEAVAKANSNTIVVNQSGTPVTMPWIDSVPAVIQAWYQGQEAGNALAEVILGLANPSGKLPSTFPKRIEDNPAYHNWPGENKRVVYGEGIYVGYRHYESAKIEPIFPFGHGLSYTTFEYGAPLFISSSQHAALTPFDTLTIEVPVTNTGSVAGNETIQLYIHDVESKLERPKKELQAFDKVHLEPGETKVATLKLDKYSVGYYDTTVSAWVAEAGEFEVLIGASSVDIRGRLSFEVEQSFTWTI